MKKVISLILTLCMVLSLSGSVFAEETYKSVLYNYEKTDTATKVGDILNFKAENVERFHIGKVNEEQLTVVVDISDPDDIKKFYNKLTSLEFTDNSDVEDAITILMRVKINDEIHTGEYYTHYGIFSEANDTNAETIEEKYISEQELYKIIDDLAYEWIVNNAGAGPLIYGGGVAPTDEEPKTSATSNPASEWAWADIEKAMSLEITENGKNYNFPAPITREEFCELIYNLCANVAGELAVDDGHIAFEDTNNVKVQILNAMGIINGKSATEFAPNDLLTREEAATILVRMVNKVMPGMPITEMYVEYTDNAEISDWAMDSIQTVSNMGGVMNGVGNGRFAPKDNFTTEQAIVTLVRVLESAGAAGVLDENTSIGIIGGADGPTSIFISEEPSVIGGTDAPTEIYIADDVEVDDFYIDEALGLAKNAGTLASDATFVSMYTAEGEVKDAIENIGKVDYSKPAEMYYISFNPDKTIEYYKQMLEATGEEAEIDFEKVLSYNRFNLTYFANMMNARYGAKSVAAAAILSNYKGYVMPKDFKNDVGIYLKYDSDFSVLVAFTEIGDGVIEARLQLVKNGEENDILSFMGELYDALGKDSVTVAKVKQ